MGDDPKLYRPAHPAQGQAPLYQRTLLVQRKRRDPFFEHKNGRYAEMWKHYTEAIDLKVQTKVVQ